MLHCNRIFLVSAILVLALLSVPGSCAAIRPGLSAPGDALAATRLGVLRDAGLGGLDALCKSGGQMYGAGGGKLVLLNESGGATRSLPIGTARVAGLSGHGPGAIIWGDPQVNCIQKLDLATGQVSRLVSLSDARWSPAGGPSKLPPGSRIIPIVVGAGELTSVASDGRFAYVAYSAGFSSSIFKVDTATGDVVAHAWAPGDQPRAMAFHDGGLFIMDAKGQEIRRMDTNLQQGARVIPAAVGGAKGLIVDDSKVQILSGSEGGLVSMATNVAAAKVGPSIQPLQIAKAAGRLVLSNRYAVLICGDTAQSCYYCDAFWNDTLWLYKTLLAKGYTKESIFVLYGNGTDFASANPKYQYPETVTDFPANIGAVNIVFDGLKNGDAARGIPQMKDTDTLFLWTFDHGSGNQPAYLCLMDGWYKDSDFAARLNAIPYARRAIFMQQCRSGGFIDDLRNSKTFISTACRSDQNAEAADSENETYGGKTYWHGEYNYYITTALSGLDANGSPANANTGGDPAISALEMHNWDVTHESRPEVPQMDDMGGVGTGFCP